MLTKTQIIKWFKDNGIGIGIQVPIVLISRFLRKAISIDNTLFYFLGKCFMPYKENFVILKFADWDEVFLCYMSYGAIFSTSKA